MDLILWRHADAHDAQPGQTDLERALTAKGERQAQRMAQWLTRQLPQGLTVLASPAQRTQQTAAALDRKVKTLAELAPGASPLALLQAAGWPAARGHVLVVGHQPTIGMAAALALTGVPQGWSVAKAGLWWLRSREREGSAGVVVMAVMTPDLL